MPEHQDQSQPAEEPPDKPRADWQWLVSGFGLLLAVAVIFFTPELPYRLHTITSVVLMLATVVAVLWFGYRVWQWRRHPERRRPRGLWVAGGTPIVLACLLLVDVTRPEETGYAAASCTFGSWGIGRGMVWARIDPDEKPAEHTVTVRWGNWVGRKSAMLTETTYFTFYKRDWRSGSVEVTVDPPADITCGDGRPSGDRPAIHFVGNDWQRKPPMTPSPSASPSPSPGPTSGGHQVVHDGGDPSGCTGDARRVHEQDVFTPGGALLGKLQLMHSLDCEALWGRLAVEPKNQPADGWDVTVRLIRAGDGRTEPFSRRVHTTAFFTGLLRDDGSCFEVQATIVAGRGNVDARTPCRAADG
ncbi:hypothetical protein AB0J82_20910 [Asanoa sp. NPDC049518]|uniref:hypothetical protein n=1 Tax=unclassified Asanoa TaxID=2685164 RepID=UPI0034267DC0